MRKLSLLALVIVSCGRGTGTPKSNVPATPEKKKESVFSVKGILDGGAGHCTCYFQRVLEPGEVGPNNAIEFWLSWPPAKNDAGCQKACEHYFEDFGHKLREALERE